MTKNDMRQAWYAMMRTKYNTDDDGVRAIMAERQRKSMASPKRKGKKHVGGFNSMGEDRRREVSMMGVKARELDARKTND